MFITIIIQYSVYQFKPLRKDTKRPKDYGVSATPTVFIQGPAPHPLTSKLLKLNLLEATPHHNLQQALSLVQTKKTTNPPHTESGIVLKTAVMSTATTLHARQHTQPSAGDN